MSSVVSEITEMEERLRLAELGPDSKFFEDALDDELVIVSENGEVSRAKAQVVMAHQPGTGPKFTEVNMMDLHIVDHGTAAVVTCQGTFEGPGMSVTLKFMRVWVKKGERWRIVAGSVSK
jgi:hypothetical protein